MTARFASLALLLCTACGRLGYRAVDAVVAPDTGAGPGERPLPPANDARLDPEDGPPADAASAPDAAPPGEADAGRDTPPDLPGVTPPATGLVGHWKLDEGMGAMAADSSVQRNHGTLQSGPRWVAGRSGGALSFTDQIANSVRVPSSPSLNGVTSGITIAAWVYTLGSGWKQTILSRQMGSGREQRYSLGIFQATIEFGGRDRPLTLAPSPFPDRRWVHVAATHDGTTARLYLDGALAASGPAAVTLGADTTPVLLGAAQEGPSLQSSMNGLLDEVRLYDRALDEAEIRALAQ